MSAVLAIDTSLNGCCAGLYDMLSGRRFAVSKPMERGQSDFLIPILQDVLKQAGRTFSDLSGLVVTRGPGTFTGVRIGLATMRTLAMTLDIPLRGVQTMQALALCAAGQGGNIGALIDSKRSDFYFQAFDMHAAALQELEVIAADDIDKTLRQHNIQIRAGYGAAGPLALPDCGVIAQRYATHPHGFFTHETDPIYLREADTTMPKSL